MLFVGGIGENIFEEDLIAQFSRFGAVEMVRIVKDFAFVDMRNEDQGHKALKGVDGTFFKGNRLRVEWSNEFKKSRRRERSSSSSTIQSSSADDKKDFEVLKLENKHLREQLNEFRTKQKKRDEDGESISPQSLKKLKSEKEKLERLVIKKRKKIIILKKRVSILTAMSKRRQTTSTSTPCTPSTPVKEEKFQERDVFDIVSDGGVQGMEGFWKIMNEKDETIKRLEGLIISMSYGDIIESDEEGEKNNKRSRSSIDGVEEEEDVNNLQPPLKKRKLSEDEEEEEEWD